MKYLVIGVVAIIIVAAVGVFLFQGNDDDDSEGGVIVQKGSDTLLELCQIWAEEYMAENSDVEVEVSGGGSSTGITALINGQVDVAQASRQIKASEIESAQAAGFTPVEFKVAIDGIAIIVHTSNDIGELTVEQLRGIYNGSITNWDQVGGADEDITLYGRQSTSGTYEFFWEHVLQKENYSQEMNMLSGNSAIVAAVQGDEGGIGYVGIGYADASGINVLDLKKDSSSEAFAPTDESAVKSGKYDLSRYLYLYTKGAPTGIVKDYLRWIVSFDDGQSMVGEIGFYEISQNAYEDNLVKMGISPASVTLTQKGSDTLLELCQLWSEDFHADNSWITVEVSGGGSSTGITALVNGQVDLAQASRKIKASEIEAAQANDVNPVEFKVAIDGIAIITHQDNPVDVLTVEQLRGIYNGSITNWNQVGGNDEAITLYGRQSTSGTYEFFWEHVLQKENYSQEMNMLSGNSAIVSAVQGDEGGIGYVGIGYADASGINVLDLKKNDTATAYSPLDADAVQSGAYDLSRYLYIYTDGTPTDQVSRWLSWILDAELGQQVAVEVGFYPLSDEVIAEERAKLG
ncbi:MAG: phosphate ABC transporter periplasmic substrate-binding protein PstS [Methanomassiliicoccales archaeon PtaB.Bin215]|nr:MAG: phosphate ABC transporter periplasmic substrate-binding protein PstS [Methanomassiliicoccales archaeon PtaB.Bin215]